MRNTKVGSEKQKYVWIFFGAIIFRIFVYLISALIMAFGITEGALSLNTFLSNWCKWDANHYIKIATLGYEGAVEFCETCRNAKLATGISSEYMENGQHLMLVFFPFYSLFVFVRIRSYDDLCEFGNRFCYERVASDNTSLADYRISAEYGRICIDGNVILNSGVTLL